MGGVMKKSTAFVLVLLLPMGVQARTVDAVGFSGGGGAYGHSRHTASLSVLAQTAPWWQSRLQGGSDLMLLGEGRLSWSARGSDALWGGSISPLLRWQFPQAIGVLSPYVQAGIGAAWFNGTHLQDTDLGSRGQFVDQLGVGLAGKSWDLALRALHYSNADLKKPNNGLDLLELSMLYRY
ncbi:acyloxyacyl hydrolase [Rhodobacteraceae bacterium CH30]|nr:acyloxyacyl hydrolase [Rhodobacteraceae bacterium CH30]